jgi:EAL domain-containing protein (putative c-di-GMP-specific phosphodiesterase class I)
VEAIDAAVQRDGFFVHYQPICGVSDGQTTGYELLIRHETLTPRDDARALIDTAERRGRVDALQLWAAQKMADDAPVLLRHAPKAVLSINISPLSFARPAFLHSLTSILRSSGLPPEMIRLEATDRSFEDFSAAVQDGLRAMRGAGYRLCADNFGAGVCTIDRLLELPFTDVKIDAAFTRSATSERFARAALRASVDIMAARGLRIIGAGADTDAAVTRLRDAGAHELQGRAICPPLPLRRSEKSRMATL